MPKAAQRWAIGLDSDTSLTMASHFATVEDYIAAQPEGARRTLEQVRDAIREALPNAEEVISYNMPTYKVGEKTVLHFAGWKRHFSLYPVKSALADALKSDLSGYQIEKSTLRLPFTKNVPVDLIKRIAKSREEEVAKE